MTIILGIDPGSIKTGFGVIDWDGKKPHYINSGCIRPQNKAMPDRLGSIFSSIQTLIQDYSPDIFAIEDVFVRKNVRSALVLGQARGAAIAAAASLSLPVFEYTPREIKKMIVGKGGAEKTQVQHMIVNLLNLPGTPQEDAADAIAVALCHAFFDQTRALNLSKV